MRTMDGWTVAPNVFCYTEMLQSCDLARRWELALQLFQDMDVPSNILGSNALLSSFHAGSKWQLALETFAMSQALVLTADMVNFVCAMDSYVTGRQLQNAPGVLQEVSSLAVATIQEVWHS